jgi:acetyl esterase/lipase
MQRKTRLNGRLGLGLAVGLALVFTPAAHAEQGAWVKLVLPIPTPIEPTPVPLPANPPGTNTAHEAWAQQTFDQRLVYNVSQPALIPVPSSGPMSDNAPAIILVPGGGFLFLAMDNEGYDVAKRLSHFGVRVFILKYRTAPLPDSFAAFKDALTALFVKGEVRKDIQNDAPLAVADTQAAIRLVRARAKEWRIDPHKVGIVGFSAGAMTVLSATQANAPDARPDFVGMIYGPTQGANVPPQAPPLFAALAADDRFFGGQDLSLIHNWRMSGSPVELHLYNSGGHGFASQPTGATSDAWFDAFTLWLRALKIVGG